MKGKWHSKPKEEKVIGHGEKNGGERDLGLKINMIMVLTETNNQDGLGSHKKEQKGRNGNC